MKQEKSQKTTWRCTGKKEYTPAPYESPLRVVSLGEVLLLDAGGATDGHVPFEYDCENALFDVGQ